MEIATNPEEATVTEHESYVERYERMAREAREARADWERISDETQRAFYAERRAEDKAAGRDTSGKSVSDRRRFAYYRTISHPEVREAADRMNAAEAAFRAHRGA